MFYGECKKNNNMFSDMVRFSTDCKLGFYGHACNQPCPPGFYGLFCGGACHPICYVEECDPVYGCKLTKEDIIPRTNSGMQVLFSLDNVPLCTKINCLLRHYQHYFYKIKPG